MRVHVIRILHLPPRLLLLGQVAFASFTRGARAGDSFADTVGSRATTSPEFSFPSPLGSLVVGRGVAVVEMDAKHGGQRASSTGAQRDDDGGRAHDDQDTQEAVDLRLGRSHRDVDIL